VNVLINSKRVIYFVLCTCVVSARDPLSSIRQHLKLRWLSGG